jgi:LmbE family N-acetylglucosaminyl deacetylase
MSTSSAAPSAPLDILFVLAHPDDESFGFAGLMAWAKSRTLRLGLVCATRGEAGEISDPSLGTPETLGAVRERELRTAMELAGVDPVRLLSYRDSGMMGTAENDDPRSLVRANPESVLADIVYHLRDLRPRAVVTFGPDGVYGHPDHIQIGAVTTEAVAVAASRQHPFLGEARTVDRLYHAAVAREDLIAMSHRATGPFAGMSPEEVAKLGIPRSEITHTFDVAAFVENKLSIIRSHATQLPYRPEPGSAGDPAMRPRLGKESLKRVPLPWNVAPGLDDELDAFNTLGNHPEPVSLA